MGHCSGAHEMEWIPVRFYGPVRNVIHGWPLEVKKELGSVLTRLQKGESIGMPDVRPIADISPQAFEIRISDRSGGYRALYTIRTEFGICFFTRSGRRAGKRLKERKRPHETGSKPFWRNLGERDETKENQRQQICNGGDAE